MKQAVMFGCIPVVIADGVQVRHHVVEACMYLDLPLLPHFQQSNIQVPYWASCIFQHLCWMWKPWFSVQRLCLIRNGEFYRQQMQNETAYCRAKILILCRMCNDRGLNLTLLLLPTLVRITRPI